MRTANPSISITVIDGAEFWSSVLQRVLTGSDRLTSVIASR